MNDGITKKDVVYITHGCSVTNSGLPRSVFSVGYFSSEFTTLSFFLIILFFIRDCKLITLTEREQKLM